MSGLFDRLAAEDAQALREASDSPGTAMLASLPDCREFGSGWVLGRELDGIRAIAARRSDLVRPFSRDATDFSQVGC